MVAITFGMQVNTVPVGPPPALEMRDEPEDEASKVNCYVCGHDEGCFSESFCLRDRDCNDWWDNAFHACCFTCGCCCARPWYRLASRIQGIFAPCCGRDYDKHVTQEYDFGCDSWFGDGSGLVFDLNYRSEETGAEGEPGCCACDKPKECCIEWPGQCTRLVCLPVTTAIDAVFTLVICTGATFCCVDSDQVWRRCVVPCYGCMEEWQSCCVLERVKEDVAPPVPIQMQDMDKS